jgi:hypothetical protein
MSEEEENFPVPKIRCEEKGRPAIVSGAREFDNGIVIDVNGKSVEMPLRKKY